MRIGIDDILAGHGIGTGGGSGGGRLEPKSARVTTTNVTQVVDVPTTLGFNPAKDMMMVFQNSVFIDKGTDYTLAEDATTIIAVEGDWTVGTIFDFLVITNTKTDLPTYDGSLIGDGTITESKLSQAILDRIEASANFDAVLGRVNEVELKMRQLREVAANAQLQMEATELVASGQSFGGNGNFSFGAPMDMAKTTTTNILDAGTTILTGKVAKHDAFQVGQTVTIYDDVNTEAVVVTKSTATELEVSALTKGYKSGSVIARSTLVPHVNGGYDYPKWNAMKGPGVARLELGTTDEMVAWVTKDSNIELSVSTRVGERVSHLEAESSTSISPTVTASKVNFSTPIKMEGLDNQYRIWSKSEYVNGQDIKFDSLGNTVSVHDVALGNKSVVKLSASGNEVWSKTDIGNAIALDILSDDSILVVHRETTGVNLRKLDSQGNEVWRKDNIGRLISICHDREGNLYAACNADPGNKAVIKMTSEGVEIWSDTSVPFAKRVITDQMGNVYVLHNAGSGAKNIRKLSSTGSEIWSKVTEFGSSMSVDKENNLYIAFDQASTNSLIKYDPSGNVLWVKFNIGLGWAVTTDRVNNVYLVLHNAMMKFDKNGLIIWSRSDFNGTGNIAVNDGGYVATINSGTVGELIVKLYAEAQKLQTFDIGHITFGVSKDASGNLFFAAQETSTTYALIKMDSIGNKIWSVPSSSIIYSVACDSLGNVYAGSQDGYLRKFDPSGKLLWGMDIGSDVFHIETYKDQWLVVGFDNGKNLAVYNSGGVRQWLTGFVDLATIKDLLVDEEGFIYMLFMSGTSRQSVRKYNSSGGTVWTKDLLGPYSSMCFYNDSLIVVGTSISVGAIKKLNLSTMELSVISNDSQFEEVALDSEGNIYVSGRFDNTIYKYTKDGMLVWKQLGNNVAIEYLHMTKDDTLICGYKSTAGKTVRYGLPRVTKDWDCVVEGNTFVVTKLSPSPMSIFINGEVVITIGVNTRFQYELIPENFLLGDNELTFRFDSGQEEIWRVNRSQNSMIVSQYLSLYDESLPIEVEFTLTGEGKLHKYIGAIG